MSSAYVQDQARFCIDTLLYFYLKNLSTVPTSLVPYAGGWGWLSRFSRMCPLTSLDLGSADSHWPGPGPLPDTGLIPTLSSTGFSRGPLLTPREVWAASGRNGCCAGGGEGSPQFRPEWFWAAESLEPPEA